MLQKYNHALLNYLHFMYLQNFNTFFTDFLFRSKEFSGT